MNWRDYFKDQGFKFVCAVYVLALFVDLFVTLRIGDVAKYLEANPLYSVGGFFGIVFVNLLIVWVSIWFYGRSSPTLRFSLMNSAVVITAIRVIIIIANWKIGNNPPSVDEAVQVTVAMKQQTIIWALLKTLWPYLLGMASFFFFSIDHQITPKVPPEVTEEDMEEE